MMPGASTHPGAAGLPPLRDELLLHPAPCSHDGSPAWTLEDPGRNQFFQIGWPQAEMLSRWHLGVAEEVAQAVSRATALELQQQDVLAFARFLEHSSLTRAHGDHARQRLVKQAAHRRGSSVGAQMLKHYLFFRIPLVRPDSFLERTLPWVQRIFFTRLFAGLTIAAGVLGLFLAARQWDRFLHTFLHFFSLEGALVAALTLATTKVLHELGHAYAAKHHGCRVATMGVAFMVLWPVLYTDASGAWRLRSRRRRMSIGAAGMLAESSLSAWALLAWSFLPEGQFQSAAFILATSTWLLTLLVNLNPLMRFDGYFLLSDLLNVPNLQQRAFALGRWRLRQWLFALGEDKPEFFSHWRERALLTYAYCVWIYRFFLFVGIALVVYHMAFKLLGIVLFFVEIVTFVARPIVSELSVWKQKLGERRFNTRSRITVGAVILLLLAGAVPWHVRVDAPALLRARQQVQLVAPMGAQFVQGWGKPGQAVRAGTALFSLNAPQLTHELSSLQQRMAVLRWQQSFQAMDQASMASVPVAQRELAAAETRYAVLRRQQEQLTLKAPFDGVIIDADSAIRPGEWMAGGDWLATLADPTQFVVEAYVSETDLHRLHVGAQAHFLAEDMRVGAIALTVEDIGRSATRRLAGVPELASPNGGAIAALRAPAAARDNAGSAAAGPDYLPEEALYRILLAAPEGDSTAMPRLQVMRGSVLIQGTAQSWLMRAWRQVAAVFIRETAF